MAVEIPLANGRGVALVDEADAPSILGFRWHRSPNGSGNVYAATVTYDKETKFQSTIRMHNQIMGRIPGLFVDHVDGDGLNNQRSNLRFATASKNSINYKNRKKVSKNGFVGVAHFKGRFYARIYVDHRQIYGGGFGTPEEAAKRRDEMAIHYFGEFAVLNFPSEPS